MLKIPCPTRWNSTFDAIQWFLQHYKNLDNLNLVLSSNNLPSFTLHDLDCLAEYCSVLDPLARVLDILQGENDCFLGIGVILPLLTRIRKKLGERQFKFVNPIRDRILERIEFRYSHSYTLWTVKARIWKFLFHDFRFGYLFKQKDHILAAAVHSYFKLNWIEESDVVQNKELRIEKIKEQLRGMMAAPILESRTSEISTVDDYLSFPSNVFNPNRAHPLDDFLKEKAVDLKSVFQKHPLLLPRSFFIEYSFPKFCPSRAPF